MTSEAAILSLNMLKDINVDILKIDMKFLDMDEKSADKGLGILEAIIRMATLMGLRTIDRGCGNRRTGLRCSWKWGACTDRDIIFFSRLPLRVMKDRWRLSENFDFRGIKARDVKSLRIKDLLNADIFSETMIHNILGGIGIYKVSGGHVELLQVE